MSGGACAMEGACVGVSERAVATHGVTPTVGPPRKSTLRPSVGSRKSFASAVPTAWNVGAWCVKLGVPTECTSLQPWPRAYWTPKVAVRLARAHESMLTVLSHHTHHSRTHTNTVAHTNAAVRRGQRAMQL